MQDRFRGGPHTELKVSILGKYLSSYTTALKDKWFTLVYIDAFAGTGRFSIDRGSPGLLADMLDEHGVVFRAGSARIALHTSPPFDIILLIEKNRRAARQLQSLEAEFPGRRIRIVEQDANEAVRRICRGTPWNDSLRIDRPIRAVMFLDPFGVSVEWDTVAAIGKTEAIDVWYLLNVEGLGRCLARSFTSISEASRRRLDRLFGGDWWQEEFYSTGDRQPDFDGRVVDNPIRSTPPEHIEQAYIARMREHFGYVHPTGLRLMKGKRHSFTLLFAVANRSQKAKATAKRIAESIIDNVERPRRRGSKSVDGQLALF